MPTKFKFHDPPFITFTSIRPSIPIKFIGTASTSIDRPIRLAFQRSVKLFSPFFLSLSFWSQRQSL